MRCSNYRCAAAMIEKHKSATALIKQRFPDCKFLHCILHRKALGSKKLKANSCDKVSELEKLMSNVVRFVCPKAKTVDSS